MISAVDNNKNQYYERVGAVNLQTSRGYPPEFYQDLMKKTNVQDTFTRQDNVPVSSNFGSLLTYGRSNTKSANPFAQNDAGNEYNLMHPDVKDNNRAQIMDLLA